MVGNLAPVIMVAIGNFRIAVILPPDDEVQLVAMARPHFLHPETPGIVKIDAERIAVAQRPDLRGNAALIGKRIIFGHAAIQIEAHDLAHIAGHVLGRGEQLPVAGSNEQVPVRRDRHPVSVMAVAGMPRRLLPDDCPLTERAAGFRQGDLYQLDHRIRLLDIARLSRRIGKIDLPGFCKVRMQDDVAQPALSPGLHIRRAADLAQLLAVHADKPQRAGLFGHQCAAIWQERHRPGRVKRLQRRGHQFHPVRAGHGETAIGPAGGIFSRRGAGGQGKACGKGGGGNEFELSHDG